MKPLDALLKKRSCLLVRILMYKHKELNNNADLTLKIIFQLDKILKQQKYFMELKPIEDLTFLPAYLPEKNKRGKVYGLQGIRKKSGVYFIRENGILVYVGMSRSNLQEALYRHFQDWSRSWKQKRVFYKNEVDVHNYEVACITTERDQAHPLEKCYILEYNPRDNHMRYEEYRNAVNIVINESEFDGIFVSNATFELPF